MGVHKQWHAKLHCRGRGCLLRLLGAAILWRQWRCFCPLCRTRVRPSFSLSHLTHELMFQKFENPIAAQMKEHNGQIAQLHADLDRVRAEEEQKGHGAGDVRRWNGIRNVVEARALLLTLFKAACDHKCVSQFGVGPLLGGCCLLGPQRQAVGGFGGARSVALLLSLMPWPTPVYALVVGFYRRRCGCSAQCWHRHTAAPFFHRAKRQRSRRRKWKPRRRC